MKRKNAFNNSPSNDIDITDQPPKKKIKDENDQEIIINQEQYSKQEDQSVLLQKKENWCNFIDTLGESFREEKINPLIMDDILINQRKYINYFEYPKISQIFFKIYQRIQNDKKDRKDRTNWTKDINILFIWIILKYNQNQKRNFNFNEDDWFFISSIIPGKSEQTCKFKWITLSTQYVSKEPWNNKEDQRIISIVEKYGKKHWTLVSQILYQESEKYENKIIYRTAKQCRDHYNNYLDPNINKNQWSCKEDEFLMSLVNQNGNKWTEICKQLVGRTENQVKNRCNQIAKTNNFQLLNQQFQQTLTTSDLNTTKQFTFYKSKFNSRATVGINSITDEGCNKLIKIDTVPRIKINQIEKNDKIQQSQQIQLPSIEKNDIIKQQSQKILFPSIHFYQELQMLEYRYIKIMKLLNSNSEQQLNPQICKTGELIVQDGGKQQVNQSAFTMYIKDEDIQKSQKNNRLKRYSDNSISKFIMNQNNSLDFDQKIQRLSETILDDIQPEKKKHRQSETIIQEIQSEKKIYRQSNDDIQPEKKKYRQSQIFIDDIQPEKKKHRQSETIIQEIQSEKKKQRQSESTSL